MCAGWGVPDSECGVHVGANGMRSLHTSRVERGHGRRHMFARVSVKRVRLGRGRCSQKTISVMAGWFPKPQRGAESKLQGVWQRR